jgi:hypothetical protein
MQPRLNPPPPGRRFLPLREMGRKPCAVVDRVGILELGFLPRYGEEVAAVLLELLGVRVAPARDFDRGAEDALRLGASDRRALSRFDDGEQTEPVELDELVPAGFGVGVVEAVGIRPALPCAEPASSVHAAHAAGVCGLLIR